MKFPHLLTVFCLVFSVFGTANAQQILQYKLQDAFPNLSFDNPLDLQHAGDGTDRLFVVSQSGLILVFENRSNVKAARIFLDIRDKVTAGGELGLLGLAFHPDYEKNGYFYVNYTAPKPLRSIIARYSVSLVNPNSADKKSEFILFQVNQPYSNHNGGQLAFGPDGYLYIALGDGGSAGDPQNNGQNKSSLLGKILRLDVNCTSDDKNYCIPPDNPFAGNTQSYREEIYAYGLRNPWRFSFDPVTGWLWVGDVGQNLWEEIDIIEKGKNYGWKIMEGNHCYKSSTCNTSGLTLPIWEYGHDDQGGCSVTGGYVYRGKKLPELYGNYVYGDYCTGRVWALKYNGINPATNALLLKEDINISSLGVDKNNEIYLCDLNGKIYKLTTNTPTPTATPTPIPTLSLTPTQSPIPGERGKIYGYVVDIKGNPLESVKVNLKGKETKIRKKTLSGTEGSFEFTDLETDTYKITAKKRGYRKGRQTVMLEEGEDEEIRIEMKKQLKHKPI
ncbi:MAG: putative glucose sorbosone dehydrogenase [Candidatus Brocadia sinica]|nr:MAG: putative glucose sorbosone dehydrogenase [Candidatus Brocadia sinica]